jgi:putative sigma-54 modulation protein
MLQLQLSGHGIEITPNLQDFVYKKFGRIKKHSNHIISIHLFLKVDKLIQLAEATIHVPGHEIMASAKSEDMYKTIDLLLAKIIRQLDKFKNKNH